MYLHTAGWKQPFNISSTLIWYHWLVLNLYFIIIVSTVLSSFYIIIVVWNHWLDNKSKKYLDLRWYFFLPGLQVFTMSVILKVLMNTNFYIKFTGIYYVGNFEITYEHQFLLRVLRWTWRTELFPTSGLTSNPT